MTSTRLRRHYAPCARSPKPTPDRRAHGSRARCPPATTDKERTMKIKRFPFLSLCVMALAAMSMVAISAPSGPASLKDVTVTVVNGRDLVHARSSGTNLALHSTRLSLTSHAQPALVTGQDHRH